MKSLKDNGQATVEYIFILAFAILFGFQVITKYTDFFSDSMGSISHVLSTHLTVGLCSQDCWYGGYDNGFKGGTP